MSAPSKAKQQKITLARGDSIVTRGEIVDCSMSIPLLSLSATPDDTMEPYLVKLAEILNRTDPQSAKFRASVSGQPDGTFAFDHCYLRDHFRSIGRISVQADQKDRFYTLRFHRRKMQWDEMEPASIIIGEIDATRFPPRSLLRRFRDRRRRC